MEICNKGLIVLLTGATLFGLEGGVSETKARGKYIPREATTDSTYPIPHSLTVKTSPWDRLVLRDKEGEVFSLQDLEKIFYDREIMPPDRRREEFETMEDYTARMRGITKRLDKVDETFDIEFSPDFCPENMLKYDMDYEVFKFIGGHGYYRNPELRKMEQFDVYRVRITPTEERYFKVPPHIAEEIRKKGGAIIKGHCSVDWINTPVKQTDSPPVIKDSRGFVVTIQEWTLDLHLYDLTLIYGGITFQGKKRKEIIR